MSTTHDQVRPPDAAGTDEGAQELRPVAVTAAAERMREVGAVLRMSEAEAQAAPTVESIDGVPVDETMIINMGPQHPSTHGVLRLMLELDGETVLRTKPVIGYLHTGMEFMGEELSYLQGPTNVTRMDYASPLFTELAFSLTTEKLLGITEEIPERVAADPAYQNASRNSDRQNARIEHDKALGRVILALMKDDTELFKQFSDNDSFRRWLSDTVFALTYA